jgi:hypothetical protein
MTSQRAFIIYARKPEQAERLLRAKVALRPEELACPILATVDQEPLQSRLVCDERRGPGA